MCMEGEEKDSQYRALQPWISTGDTFWRYTEFCKWKKSRNSVKFRGISRNYTTRNSAEFRRNFSQFCTEYGIDGSKKNRRNSVSTEFRGHPTPLWFRGEGQTRWRERGWESSNSGEGTYTVVLCLNMYFVICPRSRIHRTLTGDKVNSGCPACIRVVVPTSQATWLEGRPVRDLWIRLLYFE